MKKIILALVFLASFTGFAISQTSRNPCYTTNGSNCIGVGEDFPLPTTDFYQKVAEGVVNGYSAVAKVGYNPSVGTSQTLISGTGGAAPYMPTSATLLEIVSTSANDTAVGSGATAVFISGLDASFRETSEILLTNGTTPRVSTKTFIRVFSMVLATVGTYRGVNAGDIIVRPSGGGTTFLTMLTGQGIALTSHFTVPVGKTLYVHSLSFSIESAKSVALSLWIGTNADVVTPPYTPVFATARVGGSSASFEQQFGGLSVPIPEKTDIYITGIAAASTSAVTAVYSYILKDN